MDNQLQVYVFRFRSDYSIRIESDNIEDAITLGKASAILAGNKNPKLATAVVDGTNKLYFCSCCGSEIVDTEHGEDTCFKCAGR